MTNSKSGSMYQRTGLRNGARRAGIGVLYDDYDDESGGPVYEKCEKVRLPSDDCNPNNLNGPVICYKGPRIRTMNNLDEQDCYIQLLEELAELSHACAKRVRILRGKNPTPVTLDKAREMILEEVADVLNCLIALGYIDSFAGGEYLKKISEQKLLRWERRLIDSNKEKK